MKTKRSILILFVLLLSSNIILQGNTTLFNENDGKNNRNNLTYLSTSDSVEVDWYRTWGGSANERGYKVVLDSFENVYLTGYTNSFGAGLDDQVLLKYDSSGILQLNSTWGGSDGDRGWGIAVDSIDNIYISGSVSNTLAGDIDIVLVKYDNSGTPLWNRTWGGIHPEEGRGVAVDSSDNVYVTGYTNSVPGGGNYMVLLKYNSSGGLQWSLTSGLAYTDEGRGVAVDSSDNVYVAGLTDSYGAGGFDMFLVKYDSSGVQQWYHTWGGSDYDQAFGIAIDSSNNVYVAGGTESYGPGDFDTVLVKYDSSGTQQWNRTWGGNNIDQGTGVDLDSLGNIYLTGISESFGAVGSDIVLVKYNSSGVLQWNYTWGGSNTDEAWGITIDTLNNIYLSGQTYSYGEGMFDIVLVKYSEVEEQKEREIIPGYQLFLFISVIGVITAIWIKKRFN